MTCMLSNNVVAQTPYKFADTYRLVHVNYHAIHSSRDRFHHKHIDIKLALQSHMQPFLFQIFHAMRRQKKKKAV